MLPINYANYVPLQWAVVNFSTSGDNIVIPGLENKTIKVVRLLLGVSDATNLVFKSGTNALSGPIPQTNAGSSVILDINQGDPWYETYLGEDFIINSSAPVVCGGTIWYVYS